MIADGALLLARGEVDRLLSVQVCIDAVENVFRLHGKGKVPAPGILGIKTPHGGLHVKAGLLPGEKSYLVAKINSNFPQNRSRHDLPAIQGLIALYDGENGRPLAVLDSIDITLKRTAAASAVAAKYLARPNSSVATLCGCGQQGAAQLRALCAVLPLRKIYVFDLKPSVAQNFATSLSDVRQLEIEPVRDLGPALRQATFALPAPPQPSSSSAKNRSCREHSSLRSAPMTAASRRSIPH